MKVNDVIKTKSGNLFTVQRVGNFGPDNLEFLLLYEVKTGDLVIGYIENGTLQFINDPKQRMTIAELFDKKVVEDKWFISLLKKILNSLHCWGI